MAIPFVTYKAGYYNGLEEGNSTAYEKLADERKRINKKEQRLEELNESLQEELNRCKRNLRICKDKIEKLKENISEYEKSHEKFPVLWKFPTKINPIVSSILNVSLSFTIIVTGGAFLWIMAKIIWHSQKEKNKNK